MIGHPLVHGYISGVVSVLNLVLSYSAVDVCTLETLKSLSSTLKSHRGTRQTRLNEAPRGNDSKLNHSLFKKLSPQKRIFKCVWHTQCALKELCKRALCQVPSLQGYALLKSQALSGLLLFVFLIFAGVLFVCLLLLLSFCYHPLAPGFG